MNKFVLNVKKSASIVCGWGGGLKSISHYAKYVCMTSKIHSIVPYGFEGKLVEVEGDMNRGLPAFNIVGMANKTVNEAKERVRSAMVN